MQSAPSLTPSQLTPFLLNVATVLPVFIWGPPGIGKSALVKNFAESVGLPCISLLGSQLAPEDIIGVPQIVDGKSRFCPPTMIAQDEPYCLFLDELNACSQEVQKAFYSLILDRRIGEYHLPRGTIVIGAGNRAEDAAITRPLSSALINRLLHVQLRASAKDWLIWAGSADIHELVISLYQQSLRPSVVEATQTRRTFFDPSRLGNALTGIEFLRRQSNDRRYQNFNFWSIDPRPCPTVCGFCETP
jgi:MoxR-like ATPase